MKKVDRYFYPAVFSYEDGQEISVVFPDLDVATSGVDEDDALLSARELRSFRLGGGRRADTESYLLARHGASKERTRGIGGCIYAVSANCQYK